MSELRSGAQNEVVKETEEANERDRSALSRVGKVLGQLAVASLAAAGWLIILLFLLLAFAWLLKNFVGVLDGLFEAVRQVWE